MNKFIELNGDNYSNGLTMGRCWKKHLERRISRMREIQEDKSISDAVMTARTSDFGKLLGKISAKWLDETKGIADGAKVEYESILMLNCLPPDFHAKKAENCTSFISIGEDKNSLFKIRDERNNVQCFRIVSKSGRNFQFGHDIGNLGAAHFFSSSPLAGANNTGSKTELVTDEPKLNDCHILRYLGENSNSLEEVLINLEKLFAGKMVGGAGKNRGSIFLFVDKESGIVIECTSEDYSVQRVTKGTVIVSNNFITPKAVAWESAPPSENSLTRRKRLTELMSKKNGVFCVEDIFAFSRDRENVPDSLCNDDLVHFWMTVSAQLQVIDRKNTQKSLNYVCCGNARHSVYLPFGMKADKNFIPLLDGSFYEKTDSAYRRFLCSDRMLAAQKAFEHVMVENPDGTELFKGACDFLLSQNK
jgi:hypothetical protein